MLADWWRIKRTAQNFQAGTAASRYDLDAVAQRLSLEVIGYPSRGMGSGVSCAFAEGYPVSLGEPETR